jgi:hypothetical protein
METPEYRRVLREVVVRYARLKRKAPLPAFEDMTLPMTEHSDDQSIGTP